MISVEQALERILGALRPTPAEMIGLPDALGRVLVDMQQDVCTKLLALPMRFHDEGRRGETPPHVQL